MKLLIKNMVCPRCIIAVKEILAGVEYGSLCKHEHPSVWQES